MLDEEAAYAAVFPHVLHTTAVSRFSGSCTLTSGTEVFMLTAVVFSAQKQVDWTPVVIEPENVIPLGGVTAQAMHTDFFKCCWEHVGLLCALLRFRMAETAQPLYNFFCLSQLSEQHLKGIKTNWITRSVIMIFGDFGLIGLRHCNKICIFFLESLVCYTLRCMKFKAQQGLCNCLVCVK